MNKMPIIIFSITWLILSSMLLFIYRHAYKPMFMILTLIMYTLMMCLFIILWTWESMYSIIIFLILISGMFTMFMYFASLINNEQMMTNTPYIIYLSLFINIVVFMMLLVSIFMVQHSTMKAAIAQTHVYTVQTDKDTKNFLVKDPVLPTMLKDAQLNYASSTVQTSETISTPTPSTPSDYSSSITMMYHNPWWYFTIMCILLLLLTLFMTIKICSIQNKSMRKMSK